MFSLAIPTKKFKEDHTFSESVDLKKTKEKQNKKIYTKVFSQCYLQGMRKISWKNSKPYFSWSSWKFSFFKQNTWFLVKNKPLLKIIHQYFLVQNQFNQTITMFVLK